MSRLPLLTPEGLSETARRIYDDIAGGDRARSGTLPLVDENGGLVGPFNAMLFSPDVGDALQRLGSAIRFRTSIPDGLLELAILLVAREWRSTFEWYAHERLARHAGLSDDTIGVLHAGGRPELDSEEAAVYDFCTALLSVRAVPDGTYHRAVAVLGEPGVVELVVLAGYYTTLAMILSVFEVPVPAGEPSPFG